MNSENLHRTIEGASVQGPEDEIENSSMVNEKLLNFSACPDEYKLFIEETSLENLVYWKLFNLFEKLAELKELKKDNSKKTLREILAHVEKPLFALVLKKTKGNQSKAAEVLGCNRNTLHRKLKEFSIEPRDLRKAIKISNTFNHNKQQKTLVEKNIEVNQ